MDSWPVLFYLRKLLPDINFLNPLIQEIIHSDLSHEEKVKNILSHHFKIRRVTHTYHSHLSLINSEAKAIHKLFPAHNFKEIYDRLNYFIDMPNRKEIVLRIITFSKETTSVPVKRSNMQVMDNVNNNQPMIKSRKVEEPAPSSTMQENNALQFIENPHFSAAASSMFEKPATVTSVPSSTVLDSSIVPFSYQKVATVTSVPSSTVQEKNNVPIHDHSYFPWDKLATITTADIENAVRDDKNEPSSTVTNAYEIPDIMEHFELPVVNLELPSTMADNSTGSEVSAAQLPFVNEETVESSTVPGPEETLVTNSTDSTSKDSSVISLTHSDDASQMASNNASEVPRDSQDSTKTEIYPLDEAVINSSAIPEMDHTVAVGTPTRIKIKTRLSLGEKGKQVEAKEMKEDTVGREAQSAEETFNNAPSTSKNNDATMNNGFNLIDYVREVTNAREEIVRKYCKKFNLQTNVKPLPFLLNVLVDNIMSNVVDSEDSDVEQLIPEEFEGTAMCLSQQKVETTSNTISAEGAEAKSVQTPIEEDGDVDKQLVQHLCLVFSDACPKYIKMLCRGKVNNNEVLDNLVTKILNTNGQYPKRPQPPPEPEIIPENQLEILKEFLPDADPDYLSMMLDKFEGKPDLVKTFLNEAMEKRNYPTLKDYQRRQQLSAQQKQYTTEFNVENFVKLIPDPETFFKDPSRKLKISSADSHYILVFMRNKFNRIQIRAIQSVFSKNKCDLAKTITELEKYMTQSQFMMKSIRKPIEMPNNIENIPLLQELAYYTHKTEIDLYLKQQSQKEETEREEAKNKGLMKTCNCCYDDEVLPKDIYRCENGCEFCKSCIVKSSEVLFGEGKLDFPCLMNCSSSFTLQILQAVLSPKLFSKIAQKKALDEIKAAGIEELEMCPFCDFATIPAEGYNIFTCMNPECMKESCRMCKEPSHIPLRCDEIEKDEDVRARTFVENKMTEALLRKCWKCGVKFFKEEGCNKMTCSCGAQMCYVCGKPVDSYKHFNGNGGDRYDLCPLYSDTNVLNKENVLKGAEQAKAEIGNVALKHDPTADLNKHYQERKKMFPQNHLLPIAPAIPNQLGQDINNLIMPRPFVAPAPQAWEQNQQIRNIWMDNARYPPNAHFPGIQPLNLNLHGNQRAPMNAPPRPPLNAPHGNHRPPINAPPRPPMNAPPRPPFNAPQRPYPFM